MPSKPPLLRSFGLMVLGIGMAVTAPPLAAAQSETESTRVSKPVEGPELDTPLGTETTPEDTSSSPRADEAYGAFQRGFYLTALRLALPRADTGDPAAQTLIGTLYWNGLGVARDRKQAAEWYRFAAEGGNRDAQFAYGNLLLQGRLVDMDKKRGREYLEKSAKAGHIRAAFNVAQMITSQRPTWAGFKRALPWYEMAAKGGLADAQYALANIHAEAQGVAHNDEKLARDWLRKSALGGFDTAQLELGIWLANGRGGEKDPKAAFRWIARAAAQRNISAQNRLAKMYALGIGTKKDMIRAGAWHILSRRAGFSDSELDRVFQRLSEIDKKRALEAANQLQARIAS